MKDDQQKFLPLAGQLPARLTVEQAAWVLGCQPHDVPILIISRLLRPLGNPPPNGIKFFAASEILELVKDRSWLAKLTNTVKGQVTFAGAVTAAPFPVVIVIFRPRF